MLFIKKNIKDNNFLYEYKVATRLILDCKDNSQYIIKLMIRYTIKLIYNMLLYDSEILRHLSLVLYNRYKEMNKVLNTKYLYLEVIYI